MRPVEERLSTLTEYTATILRRWDATADRHARAVSQLEAHLRDLGDAGSRLHDDASQRLQDLERIVQQEWTSLRDLHEAPVKQLVAQAASLTEVCIATANSAQHGFDRAEARLATLEADFHRTTVELTREVHAILSEVRQLAVSGTRQLTGDAPAWPLEDVTRLHHQLREAGSEPRALPAPVDSDLVGLPASEAVRGDEPLTAAQSLSQRALTAASAPAPPSRAEELRLEDRPPHGGGRSGPRALGIAAATILAVAAGISIWRLQLDVRAATARAEQSQVESRHAAEVAEREAAARQETAARQLVAAQELAVRAQTIGDVLAAPDLVRYTLVSPGGGRAASGQVLWGRSRGFVFSASGLPAPPPNMTYRVWMLTRGGAVSAAAFVPDSGGRISVTATPAIPRPVYGALVTAEQTTGGEAPTGEPVLARFPVAAAASE